MSKAAKKTDMISSALKAFQAWRGSQKAEKVKAATPQGRTAIPKPERLTNAVEFFESNTKLNSVISARFADDGRKAAITDAERDLSNYEGMMRRQWSRRFRDIVEGSQITPLRSPDFGGVSGGSFGSKTPADHAIECGKKAGEIQMKMPPRLFKVMVLVFIEDRFIWQNNKDAITEIRMALDFVGLCLGELTEGELAKRWAVPEDYRIRAPRRWAAGFDVRVAKRRANSQAKQPVQE